MLNYVCLCVLIVLCKKYMVFCFVCCSIRINLRKNKGGNKFVNHKL